MLDDGGDEDDDNDDDGVIDDVDSVIMVIIITCRFHLIRNFSTVSELMVMKGFTHNWHNLCPSPWSRVPWKGY